MIFGTSEESYSCDVDQVIVGLDQISTLDYQRANTPGISDPRRAKVRMATEQLKLHADRVFADGFCKAGVWTNEYTGVSTTPTGKQFYQFDDANFDAVHFFGGLRTEMMRNGRRKPNVLALGVEAYEGLKRNPEILERVKYSGSTANPATINANVLAQLLDIDRVVVLNSTCLLYTSGRWQQAQQQFSRQNVDEWIFQPATGKLDYTKPVLELTNVNSRRYNIPTMFIRDGDNMLVITGNGCESSARAMMGEFSIRVFSSDGKVAARKARDLLSQAQLTDIFDDVDDAMLDRYKKMRLKCRNKPTRESY